MKKWLYNSFPCAFFILTLIITAGSTSNTYAIHLISEYIEIEVENIFYVDNDKYKIEISLINKSDKNILLKQFKDTYYTQTEVLGQWASLNKQSDNNFTDDQGHLLSSHGKQKIVTIIKIPLNIPRLFINSYGEINMELVSHMNFKIQNQDKVFELNGASLYWITPKTNKWVLREGM
jgi:hypothetical protein